MPESRRPRLWLLSQLPCDKLPEALVADVCDSQHVVVVEEHVSWSGAGRMLGELLLSLGIAPRRFRLCNAQGYPSGLYGSQNFHRRESRLDPAGILAELQEGSD